MNERQLEYIKKHIDACFAHLRPPISREELSTYKKDIMDEELLIPSLETNIASQLEILLQRVEILMYIIEAEEKRMEEEYLVFKRGD